MLVKFPKTKPEMVDEMVSRIKDDLSYFKRPSYIQYHDSVNMIANGSIEKQKQRVAGYKSL